MRINPQLEEKIQENYFQEKVDLPVDVPFPATAGDRDIVDCFYNISYRALREAYQNMDITRYKKAARLIAQAQSVALYGRGQSLTLMEDFRYKLIRIGVNAISEPLNGFESYRIRHKNRRQVAVVVSHYVDSPEIYRIFSELSYQKIPIVLVCGDDQSPYLKQASVVLYTHNEETHYKIGSFFSRTAMQFSLDCLYGMVFALNYQQNIEFIRESETRRLELKMYYEE